jgi:hypothetical protein
MLDTMRTVSEPRFEGMETLVRHRIGVASIKNKRRVC